ncbi:MAG: DUF1801 domain-containing protein [Labilithrix sp.]|nr:DUF1801 domain-containing protein [Labilithrix sp.]
MAKPTASVEAFLSALSHPFKPGIEELRAAILASDATITERIKWNAPSFCYGGDDRVTFRFPPKGGLQLVLHRGAKSKPPKGFTFDDPSGLVEWAAVDRGVVTMTSFAEVRAKKEALVSLVNAWMRATAD